MSQFGIFIMIKKMLVVLRADPTGRLFVRKVIYRFAMILGRVPDHSIAVASTQKWQPLSFIDETSEGLQVNDINSRVFVGHIFYEDYVEWCDTAFDQVLQPSSYLFTTPSEKVRDALETSLAKRNLSGKIIIAQNRGRNFGPFLVELRDEITRYQYLTHVHSKKSLHGPQDAMLAWSKYQWNLLANDSRLIARSMDILSRDQNVGLIYPVDVSLLPMFAWSWCQNRNQANQLAKQWNIELPEEYFTYPAGGMFTARTSALKQLLATQFSYSDFPDELGQLDGQLHHAIERLIGVLPKANGFAEVIYFPDSDRFTYDSNYPLTHFMTQSEQAVDFYISKFRTVSFDFFDTLYRRSVQYPDMAKLITGQILAAKNTRLNGYKLDPSQFVHLRNEAELELRQAQSFQGDVTLLQIAKSLESKLGICANELAKLEFDAELTLAQARGSVVRLLKRAIKRKQNVIIISDSYYPTSGIKQLASHIGVPDGIKYFVSSDLNIRKDSGEIWHNIESLTKSSRSNFVHVGDNTLSDMQVPATLGFGIVGLLSPTAKWEFLNHDHSENRYLRQLPDTSEKLAFLQLVSDFGDSPFIS